MWNLSQEIRSRCHRERPSEQDVIRRSSRSTVMVSVLLLLPFFLERRRTTSSGLWRRLANNGRAVCACRIIPRFCPHGRSYGAHVALAQERILRGSSQCVTLVFFSAFGAQSTCSDAELVGGLRREPFQFYPANATQRSTQSLERHSLLHFRPGHKNKRNDSSHIDYTQ